MSVFTNAASSTPAEISAYVTALLGLLDGRRPLDVLSGTEAELRRRIGAVPEKALHRAEAPGKWAVRDVLQHLADSELVWGYRIRMILAHDRPALGGYDQDAFARRLHYEEAEPAQSIEDFAVLRRANLRLLRHASADDLRRVAVHAERGEESLEHMMRLYAGHDLLHLRQIERILAG